MKPLSITCKDGKQLVSTPSTRPAGGRHWFSDTAQSKQWLSHFRTCSSCVLSLSLFAARQVDELCAEQPEGTGEWGPNSVFESRQMRVVCPEPGTGIDTSQTIWDDATGMPVLKVPDYPKGNASMPHIYQDLPTEGFGVYAYRGGLTTPPCTEIVNWNLLDVPLYASASQVDRLYRIILCMTEPTTCNHATIANEVGQTNRPVQALLDRTVLHRCEDGPESETGQPMAVPLAPVQNYLHTQTRRCVFNSENGGPLQVCWIDTVFAHFSL